LKISFHKKLFRWLGARLKLNNFAFCEKYNFYLRQ
jgi:hypothetical protein